MKIGVLTSSRADFGIYQPLLYKIQADRYFELQIIAFGTHTSRFHGFTLEDIRKEGFETVYSLTTALANDNEAAIATSYALTAMKFADFWTDHVYDLVFCLGDRYEMCAAVQAGIPSEVKFAHLHGGETTLGAIDNIYRHQISLASKLHFTATDNYADRVKLLTGSTKGVYHVGSLSLDGIENLMLPDENKLRLDFSIPPGNYALVTFHPETVSPNRNERLAIEMYQGLKRLSKDINLVITMPNADTMGSLFRKKLEQLRAHRQGNVILVENFGKRNYFAAMKYCIFLLGNTSSGIIEAASFNRYAVNVGNRQKGRVRSKNVFDCEFTADAIYKTSIEAMVFPAFTGENRYYKKGAANRIIEVLKTLHPDDIY